MKQTTKYFFLLFILLVPLSSISQPCDSLVPAFVVDLSSNPDSTWISPNIGRAGSCCGTVAPVGCDEFNVTISPAAAGVVITMSGTSFGLWEVYTNCSGPVSVGDTVFFPSPGPYSLTICNPGNSTYNYFIESIPASTGIGIITEQQKQIRIYPNPVSDFVTIRSESLNIKTYRISDLSGKTILTGAFEKTYTINLGSLSSGFYFIECSSGNHVIREKIIKR